MRLGDRTGHGAADLSRDALERCQRVLGTGQDHTALERAHDEGCERLRARLCHTLGDERLRDGLLPVTEGLRGRGFRSASRVTRQRGGDNRAAATEVACLQQRFPQLERVIYRRHRVVARQRLALPFGDELAGPDGRLLDQLLFAVREVVIDRTARRTRVRQHVVEGGAVHPVLRHQQRCAADHPLPR